MFQPRVEAAPPQTPHLTGVRPGDVAVNTLAVCDKGSGRAPVCRGQPFASRLWVATRRRFACLLPALGIGLVAARADAPGSFAAYEREARKAGTVLTLPAFEASPNAIRQSTRQVMTRANAALDRIGRVAPRRATLANTLQALDDATYAVTLVENRFSLIKETSREAALREAANEAVKQLKEWAVSTQYREDVYRAIRAYADLNPPLQGEDAKLLEDILRDYRRAGLALPPDQRQEVERLRKELTRLETDFTANINKAERAVTFSRRELEGVPERFLQQPGVKTGDDEYTVRAHVTWHFVTVMENARREATRQRLKAERFRLAAEVNLPLLREMLRLRAQIARRLGYASWADYQIEPRMARQARTAREFLLQLKTGLQPKFDAELAEFQRLKARETGDPSAVVQQWDWRYYSNQLLKERHAIDPEQLRVFFAYEQVRSGLFDIYSRVFGLRIEPATAPYLWSDDVTLHVVCDAQTAEPLGALYLDMFPREGKFSHFAQFSLIPGKRLARGRYQRPTAALVCNFPRPGTDAPSLLSYDDVQTLFHEFGHALHSLLTEARYGRFAGTRVPRDFVEVPSSALEYFARDKAVLDRFAADYRDPSRRIPQALLDQLQVARLATIGTYYRRQLTFGLLDLALHDPPGGRVEPDPVGVANTLFKEVFLPAPEDTAFVAYFMHLVGYDGGYYGYAWADAIAADVATAFRQAPEGFLDPVAGRRLRDEIFAPGGARDVEVSLRAFLGRDRSLQPFLQSIGIQGQ